MKLDSKYFDMIRIRPLRPPETPVEETGLPCCQWQGCSDPGLHRAPKGRGKEKQYWLFCSDHIRQYNSSYNYFEGMSDAQVEEFQRQSVTGHRPTWKMGANAGPQRISDAEIKRFSEARLRMAQGFYAWRARQSRKPAAEPRRKLRPLERRAYEALGLSETAGREAIKTRFKELVKRHHPDSNGGDRASEDKLREIIQAYNYLKQAGLV